MQRIVVLNPKGGSGKTTIAINLASYYALNGEQPALLDFDPQASAARWARKRQVTQAPIHLITAFEKDSRVTRAFQLRIPEATRRVIIDTPAAIDATDMPALTRQRRQDPGAGAALGHRHPGLRAQHCQPAAGG